MWRRREPNFKARKKKLAIVYTEDEPFWKEGEERNQGRRKKKLAGRLLGAREKKETTEENVF